MLKKIKKQLLNKFNPLGFENFLETIPPNSRILDVGCGNDSPRKVKSVLPNCYYIGIDICDYNQSSKVFADEYHIVEKEIFNKTIDSFSNIDVVISYHNIEHVNNRKECLNAMKKVLKRNGLLYLVTPSENSIFFPSRNGTLNYYDDITHKLTPLRFADTINNLKHNGFKIIKSRKQYRPIVFFIIGLFKELFKPQKTTFYSWCFYGFESIILAKKNNLV